MLTKCIKTRESLCFEIELVWIHVGAKLYELKHTNVCLVIIKWYQKRKEEKKLSPSLHEEGVPPQLGLLVNLKSEREKKKHTQWGSTNAHCAFFFVLRMGQNVLRLLSVPGWGHFPQLNWSEMKKKKKEASKNKLWLVQWLHLRLNPENYTHSYHIHNTLGPALIKRAAPSASHLGDVCKFWGRIFAFPPGSVNHCETFFSPRCRGFAAFPGGRAAPSEAAVVHSHLHQK